MSMITVAISLSPVRCTSAGQTPQRRTGLSAMMEVLGIAAGCDGDDRAGFGGLEGSLDRGPGLVLRAIAVGARRNRHRRTSVMSSIGDVTPATFAAGRHLATARLAGHRHLLRARQRWRPPPDRPAAPSGSKPSPHASGGTPAAGNRLLQRQLAGHTTRPAATIRPLVRRRRRLGRSSSPQLAQQERQPRGHPPCAPAYCQSRIGPPQRTSVPPNRRAGPGSRRVRTRVAVEVKSRGARSSSEKSCTLATTTRSAGSLAAMMERIVRK